MNCPTCGLKYDLHPNPPAACAERASAALKKAYEAMDTDLAQIARLRVERRGFQIMATKMFGLTGAALWRDKMEEGKYERAGANVECGSCRRLYVEHPELPGLPTFHMLCSGEIVKT